MVEAVDCFASHILYDCFGQRCDSSYLEHCIFQSMMAGKISCFAEVMGRLVVLDEDLGIEDPEIRVNQRLLYEKSC